MPLERKSPIPAGRYWLNVKTPGLDGGAQRTAFYSWVSRQNGDLAQSPDRPVQIVHAEDGPSDGMDFYIFKVLRPVPRWPDNTGLGLPDIAGPHIRSSDDTVQRPDPPKDLTDRIDDVVNSAQDSVTSSFGPLVMFAAVGLSLYLFVKVVKK